MSLSTGKDEPHRQSVHLNRGTDPASVLVSIVASLHSSDFGSSITMAPSISSRGREPALSPGRSPKTTFGRV